MPKEGKKVVRKKSVVRKKTTDEAVGKQLTPKQEKFCHLYATDTSFFGNGTRAYIEAYGLDASSKSDMKTAGARASYLLGNVGILNRVNDLLELTLNDTTVDRELAFVISQHGNLGAKMSAIKEYNRIKKRASDVNGEITINWK